ncbi:MAG: S-methyl-5'-thioadenosine phosphorylase [Acidimicrobiales bacterium]
MGPIHQQAPPPAPRAEIGIFGGTGFYEFLESSGAAEAVEVDTPFGPPSAPVMLGTLGGRRVAFMARHGLRHEVPAHRVNYRANLWALHEVGVTRVLAPCSVGSLRRELEPGDFVICDQIVDRTRGRVDTYFDGPTLAHVSFADPYCSEMRASLIEAAALADVKAHPAGTVVVIGGPRFSSRAESRWFADSGWDVVNMTQYPEAVLARELNLCFGGIALVTDYDAGVAGDGGSAVTMAEVLAVLADNVARVQRVLIEAIALIPEKAGCECGRSGPGAGAITR